MKFTKWSENKRYETHTAPGWVPCGTTVKFVDGDTGVVIQGNGERSLVEYHPRGGGWQREWFRNSDLRIKSEAAWADAESGNGQTTRKGQQS